MLSAASLAPPWAGPQRKATPAAVAANDLGYLTSACWSPTLGHDIALGFVQDGRARIGQRLRAVCGLRGIDTACQLVPPAFVDPDGGRMRG